MAENDFAPQIPGSDSVNTMTPGSAVANTLQQILAQKRAAAQEDLINQITQQRVGIEQQQANTMEGYRKEQAETNRFNRESQAQGRADTEARRQRFGDAIKGISSQTVPAPNPLVGPADPSDPNDPVGLSQKPVPLASQLGPGAQSALQLLQSLGPDDPNAGALVNAIASRMMTPPKNPAHNVYGRDAKGNLVYAGSVDEGDQVLPSEPRIPPQPNASMTPQLRAVTNPNTGKVETHWSAPVPGYDKPDFSPNSKTLYSLGDVNKLGGPTKNGKAIPLYDKTRVGNLISTFGKPNFPTALEGFLATVSDPNMKKDIRDALSDPNNKTAKTSDIMARMSAPTGLSDEDSATYLDHVNDLLSMVRSK